MAEEEKEEKQEEEVSAEKKSSPMMLIIIIVVLILLIVVGGVVALLMMGGDDNSNQMQQQNQQQMQQPQDGNYPQQNMGMSTEIGVMFPLDTFTVNLLSESGRRYLKVEMNLEINGEELAAELDAKSPVVRDVVIRLLSSKSLEEISTAKGKDKLKSQIVDQLNMRLRDGRVKNIYFTEFVVQ